MMSVNDFRPSGSGGMENAGLSEFAKHSLREMCSQDWVREKFLRDPEGLFNSEMLLDAMLTPEQVRYRNWYQNF